jgi:hypothetical protein
VEFLSIGELSKEPKAALSRLAREGKAVLTSNGKPAAIMINANVENFERVFNLVRELEKNMPGLSEAGEQERREAFERLMNFPKRLPVDFDYKKERVDAIDECVGSAD